MFTTSYYSGIIGCRPIPIMNFFYLFCDLLCYTKKNRLRAVRLSIVLNSCQRDKSIVLFGDDCSHLAQSVRLCQQSALYL